jgi:hypothetical protein
MAFVTMGAFELSFTYTDRIRTSFALPTAAIVGVCP